MADWLTTRGHDLEPVKREKLAVNPMATQTQLLETCAGRDFLALRDRALIELFWDTGARVAEIGHLGKDDVTPSTRQVTLAGKATVNDHFFRGK